MPFIHFRGRRLKVCALCSYFFFYRNDVIKWKHFPRYWPFVRGIHRSPVKSPHKGQWRGALMFTLIYARINGWVNNREAGDLRPHSAHYDVIVVISHGVKWGLVYQVQVWRSGASNYIPQYLWDVVTCPRPSYLLLVHTSWNVTLLLCKYSDSSI